MIHLTSACLSIVLAMALVPPVQAQEGPNGPSDSTTPGTPTGTAPTSTTVDSSTTTTTTTTVDPPITTTTTSTTTTTTSATTIAPITTTSTTATVPPVITTTATTPPTVPTSTTSRGGVVPPSVTRPSNSSAITTSIQPAPSSGSNSSGSSSSTSSTNVPAVVGGIVGVVALAVIVATSVICYKRRKRNHRELNFDTLEGLDNPALSSRKRASLNYLTSSSPVAGNVAPSQSGYDDYDYEMQSNAGYPTSQNYHQQAYNNGGYDGYGGSQQGYGPSPSIFQEDHAGAYATASSMGRGRTGFDQNLPEVMYNRGGIEQDLTTGYYEDDVYNQAAWTQDQHPGYVAEQGHWDAHAMIHQYDESDLPLPPNHQQAMSTPSLDSTLIGSPGRAKHQNVVVPVTAHNPQAILESPILQSASLRSGDLFGQETDVRAVGSPRIATQQLQQIQQESSTTSPRMTNASREMRSIEMTAQSPTIRNSNEASNINSYAADYQQQGRPSTDRGGASSGSGSPPSSSSNLNPNKSLRKFRREDWE
ncbi:hypothetical protein BGX29_004738 [Mortierella sp. GBA35]|nr:hypothetical protein BGX29_004738 [Mortierella sp. GBA35]